MDDILFAKTMEGAIARLKNRDYSINTVLDIGASNGSWSKMVIEYYPNAYYFLFEAQNPHEAKLIEFTRNYPNSSYVLAAAGEREGEIFFDNGDLFGGLASEDPLEGTCIVVPVTTVAREVARNGLTPPFLLKLDTHGYEVPILEGAAKVLDQTSIIIVECYNFQLTDKSLKFYEMCTYLNNKGFAPIDMVDILYRKFDNALWQMDIVFVRKDSKEFLYRDYV